MIPWKLLPYLAGLILLIGAYGYGHHNGKASSEAAWQARWDARNISEAKAAAAATAANQAALNEAQRHNDDILAKLNDRTAEVAAVARDRDLARRLLRAANAAGAPGGAVPEAGHQPGIAAPGGSGGDAGAGPLLGLVADALTECRVNADRLDALQDEIRPQL